MIVNDLYYELYDGTDRSFMVNINDVLFDTVRLSDTASFIFTVTFSEVTGKTITQVFKNEDIAMKEYNNLMSIVEANLLESDIKNNNNLGDDTSDL